jgi:GTPase SAR1 family protein
VLFDYLFKTIIVGNPGVGKTSITLRFATGMFRERYLPTIGVEFSVKDIEVDGNKVKLQTWDTSFEQLDKWFKEVYDTCEDILPAILIGNKTDVPEQREVEKEDVLEYAEKKRREFKLKTLPYYEVSAKNGQNINDIYYEITRMMIEKSIKAELS